MDRAGSHTMKILIVAYEFADPIFSGNGTHGRAVVDGLRAACVSSSNGGGGQVHIDVVTACPETEELPLGSSSEQLLTVNEGMNEDGLRRSCVRMLKVPVPASRWNRHDFQSGWREFACGASQLPALYNLDVHAYNAVCAIDWHGFFAMQALVGGIDALSRGRVSSSCCITPTTAYFNFRVFANPLLLNEDCDEMKAFLTLESAAVLCSHVTTALCAADAAQLCSNAHSFATKMQAADNAHLEDKELEALRTQSSLLRDVCRKRVTEGGGSSSSWSPQSLGISLVLPPVRAEVLREATIAEQDVTSYMAQHLPVELQPKVEMVDTATIHRRRFLVCAVRQSRDKNPHRFVELVECLAKRNELDDGVIPLMFGATPDAAYSHELRQRLLAACPTAVALTSFVSAPQMVAIYCASVLNVHPCLYDAYGLTIVEAAVCGCPTILHQSESQARSPVGVVDLLAPIIEGSGRGGEVGDDAAASRHHPLDTLFTVDMGSSIDDVAEEVHRVLLNSSRRESVASAARGIARAYDTNSCGVAVYKALFYQSGSAAAAS